MNWILVALVAAGIAAVVRIYFSLQRLRSARADDWDAKMVERVRSQGVDPFKPHEVDFFFALPAAHAIAGGGVCGRHQTGGGQLATSVQPARIEGIAPRRARHAGKEPPLQGT